MTYLSSWQSTVPQVQSAWIDRLIHRLNQEGQLRDEDLKAEIERLTKLLTAGEAEGLSRLYPAVAEQLIDAEGFNLMVSGLIGDLAAAFSEAYNLGELQETYERLYEQRIIAELRSALARLEEDVNRLSYLGNNPFGFSQAQYNGFSVQSRCTPRTHPLADLLYRDPRLNRRMTTTQECVVDTQARALTLPLDSQKLCLVEQISLETKQLAGGLGGQTLPGTRLENLIDRQADTYWIYQEATMAPAPEGLQARFQLDFGGFVAFSLVEIQPVADFPFLLTELSYENHLGQIVDLLADAGLQSRTLDRPTRLVFPRCQGRRLYVGVAQQSFQRRPLADGGAEPVPWPYGAPPPAPAPQFRPEACFYTLGFDNILVGEACYQPAGVYVSPVMEVERCALIGLNVKEVRPNRHASVEYWIVKRDFDGRGNVLQTKVVPILPLEQRQVVGETLIFTGSQGGLTHDTATLRFCGHRAGAPLGFQAYEEDRPLTDLEYRWLDNLRSLTPARIQVLNPGANLYYSVDYVPAHLTTSAAYYLDQNQSFWFAGTNALHCALQVDGREVRTSQVYLVIVMRRNPRWPNLTPQVCHYQLLAASAGE